MEKMVNLIFNVQKENRNSLLNWRYATSDGQT